MTAAPALGHHVDAVLADYLAHLAAVSVRVNPAEAGAARVLCARFGSPEGFRAAPLP